MQRSTLGSCAAASSAWANCGRSDSRSSRACARSIAARAPVTSASRRNSDDRTTGPGLQRAPRLRALVARRLDARLAEAVAQLDGALDPLGGGARSVGQRFLAGLEKTPVHRHALQAACARHRASRGDGAPRPGIQRVDVRANVARDRPRRRPGARGRTWRGPALRRPSPPARARRSSTPRGRRGRGCPARAPPRARGRALRSPPPALARARARGSGPRRGSSAGPRPRRGAPSARRSSARSAEGRARPPRTRRRPPATPRARHARRAWPGCEPRLGRRIRPASGPARTNATKGAAAAAWTSECASSPSSESTRRIALGESPVGFPRGCGRPAGGGRRRVKRRP